MSSKSLPKNLTEDQIKIWLNSTKLSRENLIDWYKQFHEFSQKNDKLNEENFVKFFEKLQHSNKESDSYYKLVFKAFDKDQSGFIEFHEFLVGFNAIGQSSAEEKLSFIFDIYDQNHDNSIDVNEMKVVLKTILKINKKNLVGDQTQDTKIDEIFDKLDENENGRISREEFIENCKNNIFLRESLAPKI